MRCTDYDLAGWTPICRGPRTDRRYPVLETRGACLRILRFFQIGHVVVAAEYLRFVSSWCDGLSIPLFSGNSLRKLIKDAPCISFSGFFLVLHYRRVPGTCRQQKMNFFLSLFAFVGLVFTAPGMAR
jgi:hypothetical protein